MALQTNKVNYYYRYRYCTVDFKIYLLNSARLDFPRNQAPISETGYLTIHYNNQKFISPINLLSLHIRCILFLPSSLIF